MTSTRRPLLRMKQVAAIVGIGYFELLLRWASDKVKLMKTFSKGHIL